MKRLCVFLATGLGLGYSPVASGTFGALLGLPLVYAMSRYCPNWMWQAASAFVLTVLAVPICDVAEKQFGKKDDGRIVADEYLLLPIAFIGIPWSPLMAVIGFVVSRFFDVLKPWPARGLQRVTGGLGVVLDDFFAAFYSLAANHMIHWLLVKYT